MDQTGLFIILLVATAWLISAGGGFSVYIALSPFQAENTVWAVVIGVSYTMAGGLGYGYVGLTLLQSNPESWIAFLLSLLLPWGAFLITGGMMLVGQRIKHGIIAYFEKLIISDAGSFYYGGTTQAVAGVDTDGAGIDLSHPESANLSIRGRS